MTLQEPPSPDWATTEAVRVAARVRANSTVFLWSKRGILPEPMIVERGRKGRMARWPLHAITQATWVTGLLDARFTWREILERIQRGEVKP